MTVLRRFLPLTLIPAAFGLAGCDSLSRAAAVPVHYASHQLCSAAFIGGVDPDQFYQDGVRPVIAPLGGLMTYRIDRQKEEVTADLAGLLTSRAVYRGPLGCQVVLPDAFGGAPVPVAPDLDPPAPALLPPIAGPDVVVPADPALVAALDRAFAENPSPPYRATKAVVILHDGKVIAERYAPGYGVDTPLIGWSMTKSVTGALIGILVRQGKLAMDAPAPVHEWSDPKDPRHAITPDNMLRMASGIDFGQSLYSDWTTAFDPTAQMIFAKPDMAAFAATASLRAKPGTEWTYTNGNTLLLSRMVRDAAGGDAASTLRFIHRELFDKLGMAHATIEFDQAGTPIGAAQMWATPRDWARFAMLYLDDGVVGGNRILPEGWVDYSARLTPGSENYGYGGGFWTNRGTGFGPDLRKRGGMPADAFFARGSQGQYAIIVPSARLVVVRMGMAFTEREDMDVVDRLVADAITAVKGR